MWSRNCIGQSGGRTCVHTHMGSCSMLKRWKYGGLWPCIVLVWVRRPKTSGSSSSCRNARLGLVVGGSRVTSPNVPVYGFLLTSFLHPLCTSSVLRSVWYDSVS